VAPGEARIARWVRPEVRALSAYQVPEDQGFLKLDAMENPYRLPSDLVEAWVEVLRQVPLNRYPDGEGRGLKRRLGVYLGVPEGAALLLGNGSDELIQMISLTVGGPGRVLLTPEPGFSMYRVIGTVAGLTTAGVPLEPGGFGLARTRVLEAIDRYRPALVIIGYPNNPTGNLFDRALLMEVIEASPGLVLVDEAYFSFSGQTLFHAIPRYRHLLVLRTLSKIGLAGLRLGALIGAPEWLSEINKTRLPYNIGALSLTSGEFLLSHGEVLEAQVRQIRAARRDLYRALHAIEGIEVWPSDTNFLLFRVRGRAEGLYEGLKREGILIKNLHGSHPLLEDCLRVTVGERAENETFLDCVRRQLQADLNGPLPGGG
jgi:histidinol-phosphate aminotransferase